jgi:hypothetical protein
MRFAISSPLFAIEFDDAGAFGDVAMLDEFMAQNDNVITYPTFLLTSDYDRTDPQSVWWAAMMFLTEFEIDDANVETVDFDPVEPEYESPRDAVF